MKLLKSALTSAVCALALFGAGPALAQDGQVIRWMHLEANQTYLDAWKDLAARYEEQNPGVRIEFEFLEDSAFKAKLPTLLGSPNAPSMFYSWGGGVLKAQAETGTIRDVTEALDANGGEWRNSINAGAIEAMTFDGKVWAVPFKQDVIAFFYNRALFEQAGVDAEAIETWDDFLDAVRRLKEAGITPIAGGGGSKWPLHFYWSYLAMREAGPEGFAAAKAGAGFDSEPFLRASQHLADLAALEPFQPGFLNTSWTDALGLFADGRVAIALGFPSTLKPESQARYASDGVGLSLETAGRFAFPVVEGAPGVVTDILGGVNGWVVTRDAPEATEDFLRYLTSLEGQIYQAERQNMLPVTTGAEIGKTDESELLALEQMKGSTWHQNFLDQDLGPNVGGVINEVSVGLAGGLITPEEAVRQIQEAWEFEQ